MAPEMADTEPSKHDNQHGGIHQSHVAKNKFIINSMLVCLTLETPYCRFALANKSICILIARLRFLLFVWLTVKFTVSILLHDCQYARVRALMWDWTIYYPVNLRVNLIRCFLSMFVYHLCSKASAFLNPSKKSFDASLLDFLARPPPPTLAPASKQLDAANYLRNRRHWFELSEKLHHSFTCVLWWVLPVCSGILLYSSVRLSHLLEIERECDMGMPLLRLVGLLELNFCLVECIATFVGAFTYSLMVKHDLLLQANQVERYLVEINTKFKARADAKQDERHASEEKDDDDDDDDDEDDYLLFEALSSAAGGGWARDVAGERSPSSYQQIPDINRWISTSSLSSGRRDHKSSRRPPVTLIDYGRAHQYTSRQLELSGVDHYRPSRASVVSIDRKRKQSRYSLAQEVDKRARASGLGELAAAIREAQTRVTLFLKCIDSHKPAVSYLGGVLLIWLVTSLSWVPVLFGNWNEPGASTRSNIIYLASCALAVSASLVFTAICAGVYQRSIDLAASIFRLCAKHPGEAEAVRWNKILLIWFSPNRCALKVGNFLQLTYLNILKSISFLVSGLTFIINYINN